MPFYRRYRRKFPRRRKVYRKKPSRSFKAKVLKVIKPEYKFADTNVQHTGGNTATIVHLTAIASSDDNTGRDGRQVVLRSIQWRIVARVDTDNIFGDYVRIIIFQDRRQHADTSPTADDILESATSTLSMIEHNSFNRFRILKDYSVAMTGSPSTSDGGQAVYSGGIWYKKGFKRLNVVTTYNGLNSSDIEKNGVYILLLAETSTSGQETQISGNIRIRFTDS